LLKLDDKIIITKDLTEIKKKIVEGSIGKIVAEITNMSSKIKILY
jgi:hypothetical protein